MNKVAQVTFAFWVTKIFATTLGETAGDLISMTLGLGYALTSLVLLGVFVFTLLPQLFSKSFHPGLYWAVILSTSMAGTTISDYLDRTLGLGYANGAMLLSGALSVVLALWWISEKSLSVSNVQTLRAQLYYWAAILLSNTLGTALGDFLADDSGLGFLGGALLIGTLIAAVAAAFIFTRWNRVTLFWLAFVLTRPFGATFGDLLTKPITTGGFGLGTAHASLALAIPLLILVVFAGFEHRRNAQSECKTPLQT